MKGYSSNTLDTILVQDTLRAQGLRLCFPCKTIKPLSEYYLSNTRRDGLNNHCNECERNVNYKRRYGITLEEYNKMLAAQSGQCAICSKQNNHAYGKTNLSVDHDHETGRVRGLICHTCNQGLRYLEDKEFFSKAIKYIENRQCLQL